MSRKRFIDVDELIDGLMVYTWHDEDGFEIYDLLWQRYSNVEREAWRRRRNK